MYGHKLTVSHFRAFGCPCTVLHLEHTPKFDSKADGCYFIRYASRTAYRVYNKVTKKIVESYDVRWLEENETNTRVGPDWIFDYATLFQSFTVVSEPDAGPHSGPSGVNDEEEEEILFGSGKPSIQVPDVIPDV